MKMLLKGNNIIVSYMGWSSRPFRKEFVILNNRVWQVSWTLTKQTDCRNVGLDNFDTPRLAPLANCVTRKCNQEKLHKLLLLLLLSWVEIEFCVVITFQTVDVQSCWSPCAIVTLIRWTIPHVGQCGVHATQAFRTVSYSKHRDPTRARS